MMSNGHDGYQFTSLDCKCQELIADRIILKTLTRWNDAYKEFPRFVMEYLVARFVDPSNPVNGQAKIDRILTENWVDSSEKELIKSRIKEKGKYNLLGNVQVRLDASKDHYWLTLPAIGENTVRITRNILVEHGDSLLSGGAWGTCTIEYDNSYKIGSRLYPFVVTDFKPFQITRVSLEDYIEKRRMFSAQEWIDLLMNTIGFNPGQFTHRQKLLYLLRLVPFVEKNYNMIELGPRETGKTYTYRNTSPRSFVISGGSTTPATLFYHKGVKRLGIIGQKDVVYFDEIGRTRFAEADATVNILKDYMQTGQFTRGDQEFTSTASIVLAGNIEIDTEDEISKPSERYPHWLAVLPAEINRDTAFIDRLHAYVPGWEFSKIKKEKYAKGFGFMTDYFAEILKRLRDRAIQTIVAALVDFGGETSRNQDSVQKTTSGLIKLIFPHRDVDTIEHEELEMCLDLAVEARQIIHTQMAKISPAEYQSRSIMAKIRV
ncbi:MAG: BREX system Lon protease-like protein BrxL [Candidatus Tectomicrobia bacterium]|uniref:BREX system Lon protease-like protein BrxL n=1 Tax=Tectimicrobiota bacterium TaxID=2528274 RepID=A0A933GP53_UNCTE|nr:BREX system Lon protease-like protein BrxL [Candidatus Tectomicrobia bacterium]